MQILHHPCSGISGLGFRILGLVHSIMEKKMETPIVDWGYIAIMENGNTATRILDKGFGIWSFEMGGLLRGILELVMGLGFRV